MAQASFEQQLLKVLLRKDFYQKYGRFINREIFPDDLGSAYDAICSAQEKSEGDLSLNVVKKLFEETNVLTTPARVAFRDAIEELHEVDEPGTDLLGPILTAIYRKEKARKITELGVRILNGEDISFSDIATLASATEEAIGADATVEVDTGLEAVLAASSPDKRFPFYLPVLQEKIRGAGPGNNIIIFARPEVGKSSFVAHNNVGYLQAGFKVAYFANEEPAHKIILNHVRANFEATEEEIRGRVGEVSVQWNKLRQNFLVYDAVDYSINDIDRIVAATNPDVVVVDQTDKLKIGGEYGRTDERLKAIYVAIREIAKRRNCLTVNVSQASADAEGRRYLSFDMLDNSKTGKPGEADIIIGIGRDTGTEDTGIRYLCVSKNKINGWHGTLNVIFNGDKCVFSA